MKKAKKGCGSIIGVCLVLLLGIGFVNSISDNNDNPNVEVEHSSDSDKVSSVEGSSKDDSENPWAASFTSINDFRYTLDDKQKTVTLERYVGDDTKILLSPVYTIDGVDYDLVSMGDDACFLCETSITSVYIPEGVTYIGSTCFNSCSSLEHLYIPATAEIETGFLDYIHEYTVQYNSAIDIPKERDTTSYKKVDNSVNNAEEAGEDVGRALNGILGGLDDSVNVNIYYGGTEEQWTQAVASDKNTESGKSDKSNKDTVAGIGGTIETKYMKITLTHAATYSEVNGELINDVPEQGNEFLVVFFEAENISDIDNTIYSSNIEAYVDNVSINSCFMFNDPENCNEFNGDLASGKKLIGYVAYEVPNNWQKFEIFYEDSYIIASDKYSFQINRSDFN